MITYQEAKEIVMNKAGESPVEVVSIYDALHRTLREDIIADRPSPPFDRVAMDGIAVSIAEENIDKGLWKIAATIQAGQESERALGLGECFEIMTGASLPGSANTVIKVEDLILESGEARLREGVKVKRGQNIHFKGMDLEQGEVAVSKGSVIRPGICGLAASMGYVQVAVTKKMMIGIVSTGGELVEIHENPLPHQIRRSNHIMIGGIVSNLAATINYYSVVDNFESTKKVVEQCLFENDICITIGGISKGKFDFVPSVLESLDIKVEFNRVKQKPGKPFIFGHRGDKNIFCLPGNPVSAFVCAHLYIVPFMQKQLGLAENRMRVRLGESESNLTEMTKFQEMKLEIIEGELFATSLSGNGSGDLRGPGRAEVIGILKAKTIYSRLDFIEIYKVNQIE